MKATKIVRLEAEAFKRLRAVAIEPSGSIVIVSGKNGAGKSSVLDSIFAALGGKRAFPRKPVREGEAEAKIVLELEELVVERKIKPDGSTQLVVRSPDGARYPSPQAMLDALVGSLSFDPLAFARMKPAEQRSLLCRLIGLDTSAIDAERESLFDERTDVNREVRRLDGELSGVPHHPDAPDTEVSVAELAEELRAAEAHQRSAADAAHDVALRQRELAQAQDVADGLRTELAELEERIAKVRERLRKGEEEVIPAREAALAEARERAEQRRAGAPDRDAIAARLAGAEKINAAVRDNRRRAELERQREAMRAESDRLTKAIDACDTKKAALVAGASYPLPGLGVDEHGVTLNAIPLEQASSAEQLRASVAIGAALQPRLRVMLVRDGSLLDRDSMQLLAQLAAEADCQIWVETCAEGAGGVVIEDGSVHCAAAEAAQ